MNEFVEQFLLEARDLTEQATADLLALEISPNDRNRLDSAFRAFHTLKGGAGIVNFDALARAMHAAEDALGAVRAGRETINAKLIGNCLSCIDQVVQWLDEMQNDGQIPADADAKTACVVARFLESAAPATEKPAVPLPCADWVQQLLSQYPAVRGAARAAVRYTPDAGCFFRGEDPLDTIALVPGLSALDVSPNPPWPPLNAFDPFTCQTILSALSTEPVESVAAALAHVEDQVEIVALSREVDGAESSGLPTAARTLLEAQIRLLDLSREDGLWGRAASAGRVAVNSLRHLNRGDDVARVESALAQSQERREPGVLAAALRAVLAGTPASGAKLASPAAPSREETIARSLRVEVARIDALVKLVGELTIVKNAIGHAAILAQDGADPKAIAKLLKEQRTLLDGLVAELQRSVLSIRVLPLRHVFQRFPRLVRELADSLGKPLTLVVEGDETEADKAIVEMLFEPLLHIIRNAADHGIEPAGQRTSKGKPPLGTINLRALREGEHVVVEVQDDGGGMDLVRMRQVAVERGVISQEAAQSMLDAEAVELIFAAGFSTAATVTGVSGRGVGMDAVRAAVERVGGRVSVRTEVGQGTIARLMLPFSVMMTRVVTVEVGGQAFGVSLDAVVETVRVPRERIVPVGAAQALVLRNRTIPVIGLAHALGRDTQAPSAEATILIVFVAGQFGGIEVERVGDQQEVMLKPMEGLLAGLWGISGTTLLGDGRVLIVLDLQELLE